MTLDDDVRAENARLRALTAQLAASAAVQGMRAGGQGGEAHALRQQVRAMQASFFWRLTLPLRLAVDLARGIPPGASAEALMLRKAAGVVRRQGLAAAVARVRAQLRWRARVRAAEQRAAGGEAARSDATGRPVEGRATEGPVPGAVLAPSVLIVAELSLQQCAKYRVWQKQEHFARLGVACRVVDWRQAEECLSAAALATQVILYRVPGYPPVLELIAAMHALRLPVAWEVDDLIFDRELFLHNRNVDSLEPAMREGILSGVELYRGAMLACGAGIASTPHLAGVMRAAGLSPVNVVENALDDDTLSLAHGLWAARGEQGTRERGAREPGSQERVLITYGSGTKTHDADFREAAPALLALLRARPQVRLRIVGELRLPEDFASVSSQVERLPPVPFARYMALLAESDIGIAPLEDTLFNDSKSNIKFLESAVLGVPSVCSPRAHFTDVVVDGENGLLADGEAGWRRALEALVDDAGLRVRMGAAARRTALARYAPEAVARDQVAPLLARSPDERVAPGLRVLLANIYYAPRSYGGATLVVEEMARRLHARRSGEGRRDVDVHVFTGLDMERPARSTTRSDQDGITVFAVPSAEGDAVGEFDNPVLGERFGEVLDAVQPDVVHLHAVQGLSASLAVACATRGIPYVITLHDAWWLCARQFMVREDSTYCFQTKIDLHVCQNCVPGARHLEQRARLMRGALDGAALLLSPSEAHRQLHLANGIAPERIVVAPNGVRLPAEPAGIGLPAEPAGIGLPAEPAGIGLPAESAGIGLPAEPLHGRRPGGVMRFAYVGGFVAVKGYGIAKRAFEALDRGDWELILVDNTLNLGFSSVDVADWRVHGTLRVLPAYTQDEMDAFFAGVDVLVFPSQWKESFGLTVREALARDVWVIATDGGGPGEAITDGVNGTLIPLDGQADGLRDAVGALLDRPGGLVGYRNPVAGEIMGYEAQAEALYGMLRGIAGRG